MTCGMTTVEISIFLSGDILGDTSGWRWNEGGHCVRFPQLKRSLCSDENVENRELEPNAQRQRMLTMQSPEGL